jgi:hypothetical protein
MQFLFGAAARKSTVIDLAGQTGVFNDPISGKPDIPRRAAWDPQRGQSTQITATT